MSSLADGPAGSAVNSTMVTGGVLEHNPALSVKAPRQKLGKGKTPVLTAEEAGELLRSIKTDDVPGLRGRALIGVMVFTFARVSAACGLNVADIFHQQRRLWVRLHEGGGKFHEMPCHHTLEGYLSEYIERARLAEAGRAPLFQAINGIVTTPAAAQGSRQAREAREIAAHASTRTTQLSIGVHSFSGPVAGPLRGAVDDLKPHFRLQLAQQGFVLVYQHLASFTPRA